MIQYKKPHSSLLELPKIKRKPEETKHLCQCLPICKSRRREWKGKIQQTSAELLIERKPLSECLRRLPRRAYPNGPCPLFGLSPIPIRIRGEEIEVDVVRICQAPIDDICDTPYIRYAEMVKKMRAVRGIIRSCPFCNCCGCCGCKRTEYTIDDPERNNKRRQDMRSFDNRIKRDYMKWRNMYN